MSEPTVSYKIGDQTVAAEPPADRRFRAAWVIEGDAIVLDSGKVREVLSQHASNKRRTLANGSAVINAGGRGIATWCDPESRGAITGLVVASGVVPDITAPWKGADGAFYTLSAADMQALALGMMAHVQSCFAAEAAVLAKIAAGTLTTIEQVEAAEDWPTG
jgi:hypothetical protein